MAADVAFGVTKFVQTDAGPSLLKSVINVLGGYGAPVGVQRVGVIVYCSVEGAVVAEDVVDPSGQRFDGAVGGSSAFLMNALAFDSVFLVGHTNGCFSGSEEGL